MKLLFVRAIGRTCVVFILSLAITAVFCTVKVNRSWAGGGQHYPNGLEDFVIGAMPPPGYYVINYMTLIQKNALVDNSGNSIGNFKADVFVEAPRFIWITPYKIFGASWGVQAILPYYTADVQFGMNGVPVPPNGPAISYNPQSNLIDSRDAGLGDMIIDPLLLGWHLSPNLHMIAAIDIWMPTGHYDNQPSDAAQSILSKNIWTFEPIYAITYLTHGFDFSAKFMYDFNTDNSKYIDPNNPTAGEEKLSPGQEFHVDWGIGYAPKEGLRLGLVGYNYWQTTDDQINSTSVKNNKSRVGGIGFGVKYWPHHGHWSLTLKHYWEYAARNIATGPSDWFKIAYKF
jgi:hypothetical protein